MCMNGMAVQFTLLVSLLERFFIKVYWIASRGPFVVGLQGSILPADCLA